MSFDPYEIGPYSAGASSARITRAAAKPLFVKDDVTTAIFGK